MACAHVFALTHPHVCSWVVNVSTFLRERVCERMQALVRNVHGHEPARVRMGRACGVLLWVRICVWVRALVQGVHSREHGLKSPSRLRHARAWVRRSSGTELGCTWGSGACGVGCA